MRILPAKTDRARLSGWVFFVAWLIGAVALVAGLEGLRGFWENLLAVLVLVVGCAAWWGAYRMSNFSNRSGFVVIALWMLGLLGALLDVGYYVRNPFFWASTVMLLFLICAASFSQVPPGPPTSSA